MNNPVIEGILGTCGAALIVALGAALWRGIISLRDNTTAIESLRKILEDWQLEGKKADEQMNRRLDDMHNQISDLQSWRNSLTATLLGTLKGN